MPIGTVELSTQRILSGQGAHCYPDKSLMKTSSRNTALYMLAIRCLKAQPCYGGRGEEVERFYVQNTIARQTMDSAVSHLPIANSSIPKRNKRLSFRFPQCPTIFEPPDLSVSCPLSRLPFFFCLFVWHRSVYCSTLALFSASWPSALPRALLQLLPRLSSSLSSC